MKSICFFISSNGLGHLDRVLSICNFLQNKKINLNVYCTKWQYEYLKKNYPNLKVNFKFIDDNNLKWNVITDTNFFDIKLYKNWFYKFKNEIKKYDLVISDNLLYFLKFRNDVILLSSFFWFDVFDRYFQSNNLLEFEKELLYKHSPFIFTNKFLEIGTVANYKNKINFEWGHELNQHNNKNFKLNKIVLVNPSLKYFDYEQKMNEISKKSMLPISNNLKDIDNSLFIIRPGGGMVTYCVSNNIPFVSLINKNDSYEILQIAKNLNNNNICNYLETDKNFIVPNLSQLKKQMDNYKNLNFGGYKKIANKIMDII